MNVIIVGGAGRVGRMIAAPLARDHRLRIVDRDVSSVAGSVDAEYLAADVLDYAQMSQLAEGQDAIIYLAMGVRGPHGRDGSGAITHFDVSVKGLYLTLRAAAVAGVRRAVYASSLSIFTSYLEHGHTLQSRVPDAVDGYGLTKRLAEQVAAAAATEHGMSVVALRLCGPLSDQDWLNFQGRCPAVMTAGTDVADAFRRAIEYAEPGFEPLIVSGDHLERYITWSRTKELLGWEPTMRRSVP